MHAKIERFKKSNICQKNDILICYLILKEVRK